ncbi:MAG: cation transporter [bacterium]|nr:cation transporter [bacterium]
MKKVYKLQELDCANCAAKMEQAISKIAGVEKASVNFMMQKLTLEAAEADLPRILEEAQKAITKIERYCRIVM